jgi:uncharacterized protein YdeI (YjbR/CyaY-like superfamily)
MPQRTPNPKADFYFEKGKWQAELRLLRKIILSCGLEEVVKWGCPCYTHHEKNIVLLHAFKEYCAMLFFKGSLMADPDNILVQQTKNVQAARQIRFTEISAVKAQSASLKAYVHEAIEIETSGKKPELKKTRDFEVVPEFEAQLKKHAALKQAFKALTPGRQRAYLLHFSSAKRPQTRAERIQKCIPPILKGMGLNDRTR